MTSSNFGLPLFDAAVADRNFCRVEKAEGLAGSYYNLLIVVINTLPT